MGEIDSGTERTLRRNRAAVSSEKNRNALPPNLQEKAVDVWNPPNAESQVKTTIRLTKKTWHEVQDVTHLTAQDGLGLTRQMNEEVQTTVALSIKFYGETAIKEVTRTSVSRHTEKARDEAIRGLDIVEICAVRSVSPGISACDRWSSCFANRLCAQWLRVRFRLVTKIVSLSDESSEWQRVCQRVSTFRQTR